MQHTIIFAMNKKAKIVSNEYKNAKIKNSNII